MFNLFTKNRSSKKRIIEEWVYEQVADELDSGDVRKGLWTKARGLSYGDVNKCESIYIQLRAESIVDEAKVTIEAQEIARKNKEKEIAQQQKIQKEAEILRAKALSEQKKLDDERKKRQQEIAQQQKFKKEAEILRARRISEQKQQDDERNKRQQEIAQQQKIQKEAEILRTKALSEQKQQDKERKKKQQEIDRLYILDNMTPKSLEAKLLDAIAENDLNKAKSLIEQGAIIDHGNTNISHSDYADMYGNSLMIELIRSCSNR